MKITKTSPISGKTTTRHLNVTNEQIERWQKGELIQEVFPHLSPEDREFLKTGITTREWQELFG